MEAAGEFASMVSTHMDEREKRLQVLKEGRRKSKGTPRAHSLRDKEPLTPRVHSPRDSGATRRTVAGHSPRKADALIKLPDIDSPRDARLTRYWQLRSTRRTADDVCRAEETWQQKVQHDWLTRHSHGHVPRSVITEERRAALKEAFDMMDTDGSGFIDYSELAITMRALGFASEDIRAAISAGDHDVRGRASIPCAR